MTVFFFIIVLIETRLRHVQELSWLESRFPPCASLHHHIAVDSALFLQLNVPLCKHCLFLVVQTSLLRERC